jgi:hypothetical protein
MLQYLVVGLIVLAAALYAAAKYLPLAWRRKFVYKFSDGSGRGLLARWLDKDAGCGSGCKTCNTCATPAEPSAPAGGKHRVIRLHEKR